jgi:hypothetical protein
VVKAVHIMELRAALANVYSAASITAPVYTDSTVDPGVTIKVAHFAELRAAVAALEK